MTKQCAVEEDDILDFDDGDGADTTTVVTTTVVTAQHIAKSGNYEGSNHEKCK
jgi:hypothetical protein